MKIWTAVSVLSSPSTVPHDSAGFSLRRPSQSFLWKMHDVLSVSHKLPVLIC